MAVLSSSQWEKINEIVLYINSERDIYKLRINFLEHLQELIPHDKSFFDLGTIKGTKVVFFDPVTKNIESDFMVSYFKEYESIDTMFWFFSQEQEEIYRESNYITPAMLETSMFYTGWMLPQNIRFGMGARVAKGSVLYGSINIWRSRDKGDFTDEELEILRVLNNHLSLYFYNKYPNGIKRNNENDYSETLIHLYNLTDREADVIELVYQGKSSREIAASLYISENTVKKHIYNIFKKMKVSSRSQMIKIVHGFLTTSVDNITSEQLRKLQES